MQHILEFSTKQKQQCSAATDHMNIMKHTEFSPVEDSKLWTWSVRDKMSFAKAK